MALPATEDFTGSNGTQIGDLTNWTANTSPDLDIYNNEATSDSPGDSADHWSSDSFDADQYAEATVTTINVDGIGVAVRCHASANTLYGWYSDSGTSYLFKSVASAWTQLGSAGAAFSTSDVIRLEVSGVDPGTLTPMVGGAEEDPPGAQTDSDIDDGYAGICGYYDGGNSRIDNWEGGNLGAPGETLAIAVVPTDSAYDVAKPIIVG